jgi:hypothetical protein
MMIIESLMAALAAVGFNSFMLAMVGNMTKHKTVCAELMRGAGSEAAGQITDTNMKVRRLRSEAK